MGTIYLNDEEYGSGTNVVANPSGTATATLQKLTVGTSIYDIPSGASDLDDLSDVNITTPSSGQVIKYNSTSQKWENSAESGGTTVVPNPSGTATETLNTVQIGTSIYDLPSGGGGATDLDDLTDVEITSPTNGQVLKYNSTTSKWENGTGGGSANIDEMTQSAYDALPSTKLSDNVVRFAYYDGGTPQLDPNYTYVTYGQDDEIIVRIYHEGEEDEEILWFFNGFTKTADDWSIPAELQPYVPDNITSASYTFDSDSSTTQTGWIGWHSGLGTMNLLRSWTVNWTQVLGGTFYAVVDISRGQYQDTQYYDPYVYLPPDTIRHIYLNGRQYSGEGGGSGSGGEFVNITPTQYDQLTPSQKEDASKLYLISGTNRENRYINQSSGGITFGHESSMSLTASAKSDVVVWDGGSGLGAQINFNTAIDVTDIDEIKYDLVTRTCWGHTSSSVEEQDLNVGWQIKIGVCQTIPSGWISDSMSSYLAYNNHKYTNTEYTELECTLDVSSITGTVYLVASVHGWNLTLSNIRYVADGVDISCIKYKDVTYATGLTKDSLFTNTSAPNPATIILPHPITDYDMILFQVKSGSNAIMSMTYDVDCISPGDTIGAGWYNGIFVWYYYTDANTLTYRTEAPGTGNYISNIVGIKY